GGVPTSLPIHDGLAEAVRLEQVGADAAELGEWRRAREAFTAGLSIAGEQGDRHLAARCILRLGEVELAQRGFRPATEWFTRALTVAQEVGDRSLEGRALCGLGSAYAGQHDFNRGIAALLQALSLAADLRNQ